RVSYILSIHSITTVSKVSVEAGKPISIPCLYESQYIDHVKYLCEGHTWRSCSYAVKTNTADPSGKYLISDDKIQKIFTVTINELTDKNTDYWCVVEIDNGKDYGQYFRLLVISGTPSVYVDHQRITGYTGESITIRCHHSNSGAMKWCRLDRNCVTGSFGSIDGTTVTAYMRDPNVFTVTMSGLQSEDSGWYLCAGGDIQIPVYLTVTEKPITSATTTSGKKKNSAILHILSVRTVRGISIIIITVLNLIKIHFKFICKSLEIVQHLSYCALLQRISNSHFVLLEQNKAESSATAMVSCTDLFLCGHRT
uniref:Immunoglobulin domain-containing protein n=1 Tax=Maylandia zebra TaxID=106582 RepID=A0A3P9DRD8_9CICH